MESALVGSTIYREVKMVAIKYCFECGEPAKIKCNHCKDWICELCYNEHNTGQCLDEDLYDDRTAGYHPIDIIRYE